MELFDSHFHIINPKYPLIRNNGYLPDPFTLEDYSNITKPINIIGGAIVSGSFQAFAQEYLIDSLNKLGNNFVGVANIPITISDNELERLNASNVVAVRFNLKRGGSASLKDMNSLSDKVLDQFGWHTELYVDSKDLKILKPKLKLLKSFSIDHLGLSKIGLSELYYWAEKGIKIKATGFGRVNFDPLPVLKNLYNINPNCLLFGTDLPSTRAKIPFSNLDIELISTNFSKDEQERVFYKNAQEWYLK